MFKSNHFYGHVQILREYCGGLRPPFVPGVLQHGWQPGDGVGPQHREGRWPRYLWSARNLKVARAQGLERLRAIGAPFLYLPHRPRPPGRGVLVLPFHGWHQQEVVGDMDLYARSLDALRADGHEHITVCLYYLDHARPEVRHVFESRGYPTVTAGPRLNNPRFLHKLTSLFEDHAYVSSNRVCTATFYALHLERRFFLHGPTMGLSKTEDPTGEKFDAWQRAEFPQLTYEGFADRAHTDLGRRELGAEFKRSPDELAEVLMWDPRELRRLARALRARGRDLARKGLRAGARRILRAP